LHAEDLSEKESGGEQENGTSRKSILMAQKERENADLEKKKAFKDAEIKVIILLHFSKF